ncbi:MAG: NADH-quinone oxidoreductase subunit G [Acidimicrobiales bacterium]|jgi:NADH-quinone oxidoreductase subunit G
MADAEAITETAVNITINGEAVQAKPGELLIAAAERTGTYIPRFCYHERMKPVGMCRMCLVDVDAGRGPGLQPSCMISVSEGMVVDTESDRTKRAQEGILELLLVNHPLDCPVCDKGGECPLQDQTMAYGPGESRFIEEKRHYEKPIPISDLVFLDRERCILCDRCTRFAADVAGDPLIHFIDRGNETQVNTFPDHPFSSYFSGNTVQICPVGALTAEPYRFKARPWDLAETESTSVIDPTGARVALQSSRDRLVRVLGVDSDAVNWGWLSDKERFAYESASSDRRLVEPLLRSGDEFVPTRWNDATTSAAAALTDRRVGVLGGARLSLEGQFAWSQALVKLSASFDADAQLDDGLPAEFVLGLPRATVDSACAPGGVVVLVGADPKEELPTFFLRLRHAIVEDGVSLIELTPRATSLSNHAAVSLHPLAGTVGQMASAIGSGEKSPAGADAAGVAAAGELLRSGRQVTIVVGRGNLAESAQFTVDAVAALLALAPEAKVLPALRRGNIHGAFEMGLAPGFGPGGVADDSGDRDAAAILQAAADGEVDTLLLLGCDPICDFPDRALAERAFDNVSTVVAVDLFMTDSCRRADIVVPAAGFGEVDGTFMNFEGRLSPLRAQVTPPGQARTDWMIAVEVATEAGFDLGFGTIDACRASISSTVPTFKDVDWASVLVAGDGPLLALDRAWAMQFGEPFVAPAVDGYGLRLVVDRKLWDQGTLVQESQTLAHLAGVATLSLSPTDFDRLGVRPGEEVSIEIGGATHRLAASPSPDLPKGAARIPYRLAGFDPGLLLTATDPVTEIRVSAS